MLKLIFKKNVFSEPTMRYLKITIGKKTSEETKGLWQNRQGPPPHLLFLDFGYLAMQVGRWPTKG